jgi:hypothetical protein
MVTVQGHLLRIVGDGRNLSDRDGAECEQTDVEVPRTLAGKLWANQSYSGELVDWVKDKFGIELEIVKKCVGSLLVDALRQGRLTS